MSDQQQTAAAPGGAFREGFVEADGFRIRYCEAGQGAAARASARRRWAAPQRRRTICWRARFRVIAIEMPGFGTVAGEHPDPHDAGAGGNDRARQPTRSASTAST